jgi:hypothetical protein
LVRTTHAQTRPRRARARRDKSWTRQSVPAPRHPRPSLDPSSLLRHHQVTSYL